MRPKLDKETGESWEEIVLRSRFELYRPGEIPYGQKSGHPLWPDHLARLGTNAQAPEAE